MAAKPKKRTTKKKTTIKKKTSTKKTSTNKRPRKKTKQKSHFKKNIFMVLGLFLILFFVVFGYFSGQSDTDKKGTDRTTQNKIKTEMTESYTTKELLEDLSKIQVRKPEEGREKNPPLAKASAVENPSVFSMVKQKELIKAEALKRERPYAERVEPEKALGKKREVALAYRGKKPKLAIVIDDVSSVKQMKRIKALKIKVTPSIFPPSGLSMTSHKLAIGLKHYMIHLPMESGSNQFNTQYKTLKTDQTKEQIEARIKELRALFPTARYVNNHTGSVFTNHYQAMHRLYTALRKEGFVFVDSRTIGSTKVRKIAHEFGDAYVARDVFLDNKHTLKAIHKQLRQAVKIAKKKGYAVAIGHPHKITIQALAQAGDILKEVELVYIDEIFRRKR